MMAPIAPFLYDAPNSMQNHDVIYGFPESNGEPVINQESREIGLLYVFNILFIIFLYIRNQQ